MTSGRKLSAAEAHGWGLVSEVVEGDGLAGTTAELAAQYAAMPTRGVGLTKRLFDEAEHNTLEEQLELEAELQTAATQTADFREGVDASRERDPTRPARPPAAAPAFLESGRDSQGVHDGARRSRHQAAPHAAQCACRRRRGSLHSAQGAITCRPQPRSARSRDRVAAERASPFRTRHCGIRRAG